MSPNYLFFFILAKFSNLTVTAKSRRRYTKTIKILQKNVNDIVFATRIHSKMQFGIWVLAKRVIHNKDFILHAKDLITVTIYGTYSPYHMY